MKENFKPSITKMAFAALFTAVIAIVSQIAVLTPVGVPLTLQTLAVALCGYVLGSRWGTAAVGTYILLGAVGVPVFSGFRGGVHTLFGITGGFIFGFLALAFFCGSAQKFKKGYIKILLGLTGLLLCHLWGAVQLAVISKSGIREALITASLPYILKDIILLLAAFFIAKYIERYIKNI